MSSKDVIKTIQHYKKSIETAEDEKRVLHCIKVLYKVPMTVESLQETGVGRTINSLYKSEVGEVRAAAKGLVNKWKALVVVNESSADDDVAARPSHDQDEAQERRRSGHHDRKHHESKSSSSHKVDENSSRHKEPKEHRSHGKSHSTSNSSGNDRDRGKSSRESSSRREHSKDAKSSSSSKEEKKKEERSSHSHRSKSGKDRKRSREESDTKERSTKRPREESTMEIDSSAGTSFADALAMMDGPSTPAKPSSSKKPSTSTTSVRTNGNVIPSTSKDSGGKSVPSHATPRQSLAQRSSSGPSRSSSSSSGAPKLNLLAPSAKLAPLLDADELTKDILGPSVVISNSYTPASYLNATIQKNKRSLTGTAALPSSSDTNFEILQSKARTKVYSGNKGAQTVATLHEMCLRVLQKNIDALEYTGGVPFDILEPILVKCSANQLDQIEYYNPYLSEDTNDLWKMHVQRQYRGKKRQEMESWREMYQVSRGFHFFPLVSVQYQHFSSSSAANKRNRIACPR